MFNAAKLFGATDSPLPVDHARSVGESAKPGVIGEVPPEPDRVAAESKTTAKTVNHSRVPS
jgi:hypothetical protein